MCAGVVVGVSVWVCSSAGYQQIYFSRNYLSAVTVIPSSIVEAVIAYKKYTLSTSLVKYANVHMQGKSPVSCYYSKYRTVAVTRLFLPQNSNNDINS